MPSHAACGVACLRSNGKLAMSSFSTGRLALRARAHVSSDLSSFQLQGVQWHWPDGRPAWQEPLHLSIGRERLGLVGRNGVGKSVLAQILGGAMPSAGTVFRRGSVHVVAAPLLPQDKRSVGEVMGLGPVLEATRRLAAGLATTQDLVLTDGRWDLRARA